MATKRSTAEVMNTLVGDLQPVRRLAPPWQRAVLWIAAVTVIAALVVAKFAHVDAFVTRLHDPGVALECAGALATGVLSVVAAFHLSIPGRTPAWLGLPFAAYLLWFGASAYHCYRSWFADGGVVGTVEDSSQCFTFIVAASLPLSVVLFALLRRAYPLAPGPLGAAAALGVGGFAALLLQFFHPLYLVPVDLGAHTAAVALVVAVGALLGPKVLR
jgi:hypothetical protein